MKEEKTRKEKDDPVEFVKVVREQLRSCIKQLEQGSATSAALKFHQLVWVMDDFLKQNHVDQG